MKKKSILFIAAIVVLSIASCSHKKEISSITKSTRVELPLQGSKYNTDKKYIRAVQNGQSPNIATAKKIALQNAKTEIAQNITSIMKIVSEQYTNQSSAGNTNDYENKFEENSRSVVNQELSNIKIIGEEVLKEKKGDYSYWIAIEINKEELADKMKNKLSTDAKTKLNFDHARFKKIFDEEMNKFEQQ